MGKILLMYIYTGHSHNNPVLMYNIYIMFFLRKHLYYVEDYNKAFYIV
jgi:hypothetical protein